MTDTTRDNTERGAEAGFTLVEALVAVVVLVFGLMAVTNLLLVAASSNSVANQSTAGAGAQGAPAAGLQNPPRRRKRRVGPGSVSPDGTKRTPVGSFWRGPNRSALVAAMSSWTNR